MIYKDFQGTKLSALGLGLMRLPVIDENVADIDEAVAEEMIDYAYKNGINYFDTAWGYHDGNSELVAGKYLSKYPRDTYYLATKFPGYDNSNFGKVEEIFEKQLEKCQTTYFDFYLFHNVYEGNIDDYLNPEYKTFEYLLEQKKNGRIKHLGFSTHGSYEVISRFLEAYGEHMEFCQLQLNYMDWHFQSCEDKVKLVGDRGIPVWVMEPLRGGRLANVSEEMSVKMKEFRPNENIPAWAFRFLQSIPEVRMVLSGMSDMEQLKENISTYKDDRPLSDEEMKWLIESIDIESKMARVPCTACSYCITHCPKQLPIPKLIALYNEHKITGGGFIAPMAISSMPKEKQPANCIGCRSCEKVCPQGIKISEVIKELSDMVGM